MFLKNMEFATGLEQWPRKARIFAGVLCCRQVLYQQVSRRTLLDPNFNCSNHCSAVNFGSMFGSLYDLTPLTGAVNVLSRAHQLPDTKKRTLQHIREGEEKALSVVFLMILDELLIAFLVTSLPSFWLWQLSKVVYWRTLSVTGNKEVGLGGWGQEITMQGIHVLYLERVNV